MELNNTIQEIHQLGKNVVKDGKSILKIKKKTTKANTLYNEFDYVVTSDKSTVTLTFDFGRASDYWDFVVEGVRGSGSTKGRSKTTGQFMRGQGSPFKFCTKMPARGAIDRWIVSKPLRAGRDKSGRFIARKRLAFLIQRSIFQRGLERTQFFSKPFTQQLKKQTYNIVKSFADHLE